MSKNLVKQPGLARSTDLFFDGNVIKNRIEDDDIIITPAGSGSVIITVTNPSDPNGAATKAYVDSSVASSQNVDVKDSCRLATVTDLDANASITGAVTYNNTGGTSAKGQITATLAVSNTFTVDGVSLSSTNDGTRILLKNEASGAGDGSSNGIWTTTISGTSLTLDRAEDFDSDAEVTACAFTFIEEGTTNADQGFLLSTNDPITLGTASGTVLAFSQFTGSGGGGGVTETATNNVAAGTTALDSLTTGDENTAYGAAALTAITTTSNNTAVGSQALVACTGTSNVAVGHQAGDNCTSTDNNIAIGKDAMGGTASVTTADETIAIGSNALQSLTSGTGNVAIGFDALKTNATASNSIAIGSNTLENCTIGSHIAIGNNALTTLTGTSNNHIAIGANALTLATAGSNNCIAIGNNALDNVTSGTFNIGIGTNAGTAINIGARNVMIGINTGNAVTTGSFNIGIGAETLQAVTTEVNNTAIGYCALQLAASNGNTAVGRQALENTDGDNNVGIGLNAGLGANTGAENVFVGVEAGSGVGNKSGNTCIGYQAGDDLTTGDDNTCLGRNAGQFLTTGSGNICIGSGVDGVAGESNITRLGPTTNVTTYTYGSLLTNNNTTQTTDATVTSIATIATANDIVYLVTANVVGIIDSTAASGAGYKLSAAFKNDGGTLTQIGTTTQTVYEDVGGWDATIDASGTDIRIRITGAGGTTINWSSTYNVETVSA